MTWQVDAENLPNLLSHFEKRKLRDKVMIDAEACFAHNELITSVLFLIVLDVGYLWYLLHHSERRRISRYRSSQLDEWRHLWLSNEVTHIFLTFSLNSSVYSLILVGSWWFEFTCLLECRYHFIWRQFLQLIHLQPPLVNIPIHMEEVGNIPAYHYIRRLHGVYEGPAEFIPGKAFPLEVNMHLMNGMDVPCVRMLFWREYRCCFW